MHVSMTCTYDKTWAEQLRAAAVGRATLPRVHLIFIKATASPFAQINISCTKGEGSPMMYGWWQYGAAPLGPVLVILFVVATLAVVAWILRMPSHRKDSMGKWSGRPGSAA